MNFEISSEINLCAATNPLYYNIAEIKKKNMYISFIHSELFVKAVIAGWWPDILVNDYQLPMISDMQVGYLF